MEKKTHNKTKQDKIKRNTTKQAKQMNAIAKATTGDRTLQISNSDHSVFAKFNLRGSTGSLRKDDVDERVNVI